MRATASPTSPTCDALRNPTMFRSGRGVMMSEEVIRWHTPIPPMRRTARRDVESRGRRIARGEKVAMWVSFGNCDEDVFPDGEAIRVGRADIVRHGMTPSAYRQPHGLKGGLPDDAARPLH